MSFASLGLIEPIVRAVAERGYTTPTPIQAQAIPVVLEGGDLMAAAQTGTGKTAGFTLPLLQRLATTTARKPRAIRALVLTPTRELAAQVEESVRHYGVHLPLKSFVMFGGVNINPQIDALRQGIDLLVATPGRLLDHVQQKTIDLSGIEILVLDEADRMLDMGFIRDIRKILALLPKQRQNLLFSATFSDEIKKLADGLLDRPRMVEVARRNTTTEQVAQRVMLVGQKAKRHLLAHLIREQQWFQVLVFTRTKHGANRLAEQLTKASIPALAIHGNKSQNARTRALSEFKSGELQVLVATDIAARGLDIVELPHVVNFELPNVPEDYVHRIGRTGRAGATGEALSLVSPDEEKLLRDIEKFTRRSIERAEVPAFEIPASAAGENDAQERPERAERSPQGRGKPRGARSGEAAPARREPRDGRDGRSRDSGRKPASGAATPGAKPAGAARAGEGRRPRRPEEGTARNSERRGRSEDSRASNRPRGEARPNESRPRAASAARAEAPAAAAPNGGGVRGVFARSLSALRKLAE